MKNQLAAIAAIAIVGATSVSNAACYSYRHNFIRDGVSTCADKSAKLATVCISEENVAPLEHKVKNLFSGSYKIKVTNPTGEVLVISQYHVKQATMIDGVTTNDYRAMPDSFVYGSSGVPHYKVTTVSSAPGSAMLKIGEGSFCAEVE
jgi:hypothetical protein